ncbi:hypothetical protein EGX95_01010 (plasmid) [Bacillus sp. FDAARGOS_527]|nr:hypothetical protein EGX95_01010 [Bacillus sp. FDAARGOS_527]
MKDLLPSFATHGCWHIKNANGKTTLCIFYMLIIICKVKCIALLKCSKKELQKLIPKAVL